MKILIAFELILAAVFVLAGLLGRSVARREYSWVKVPGSVISSRVQHRQDVDAELVYRYEYEGAGYQGTRIVSFLMGVIWAQRAEGWVAKYPAGSTVTVYVNPADPRSAVLEPGGDPRFFTSMFSSAGLLLFMVYLSWDL